MLCCCLLRKAACGAKDSFTLEEELLCLTCRQTPYQKAKDEKQAVTE